jgi:RNA polymerase sigma-70 factor (ECF subfamily)
MTRHAFATVAVQHEHEADNRPSDEQLLAAYRDHGDRQAFDQLVHRYERELYSYLRRYLGDASAAEDAFQACFLQVHLRCHQFEEGRKFKPWLYAIATNGAIDAQRRSRRQRTISLDRRAESEDDSLGSLAELIESRESTPGDQYESTRRQQWIRQAVSELPENLRSVVTMIYYQGLKYREVADALHVPVGTIKSRMHAAVYKLNEAWHVQLANEPENPSHA